MFATPIPGVIFQPNPSQSLHFLEKMRDSTPAHSQAGGDLGRGGAFAKPQEIAKYFELGVGQGRRQPGFGSGAKGVRRRRQSIEDL